MSKLEQAGDSTTASPDWASAPGRVDGRVHRRRALDRERARERRLHLVGGLADQDGGAADAREHRG